jgi:formate-dependent nitrite reductase membrane component NrfD
VSHGHGTPPEERARRDHRRVAGSRDTTPAVGRRGEPGRWRRAAEGAAVALHRRRWEDGRWSYLFKRDTRYRASAADSERVAAAARRMRGGEELPEVVQGPMINQAVWTWEIPLYFWFGGMASGSAFVSLACHAVGDERAAAVARKVTLAAVLPSAPLLVMDLGRPMRFLHMLRIFKTRSPMSVGAWCLVFFSQTAAGAVGAELIGRRRLARALDVSTALLGTVLGSYTGVLLASTAVPVWARSRVFLPPIFICTATATGAAANRLALAASGVRPGDPSRTALGTVETAAMGAELLLSSLNERRLGRYGEALDEGRANRLFELAKWSVRGGLALRFARGRGGPWVHHLASVMYLLGGLSFRFAWVAAGRNSAHDDEAVARMARMKAADLGRERA